MESRWKRRRGGRVRRLRRSGAIAARRPPRCARAQGAVAREQPGQLLVGELLEQLRRGPPGAARRSRGRRHARPRSGWTSTTRRSSPSWRRSTRPRFSIRSTMPVTLATETSSASARRLIDCGPVRVEDRQHVEVDEADRAVVPAPERSDELARVPRQELVDDLVGQSPSEIRVRPCGRDFLRRGIGLGRVDIQWHINNLRGAKRSGKTLAPLGDIQRLALDVEDEEMSGTSHRMQLDKPEEFNRILDRFLARVEGPS